jgi:hypothetical protein
MADFGWRWPSAPAGSTLAGLGGITQMLNDLNLDLSDALAAIGRAHCIDA